MSLLINYLLGKRLGYARGEDGKLMQTIGGRRRCINSIKSIIHSRHPLRKGARSSLPRQILIMRDDYGRVSGSIATLFQTPILVRIMEVCKRKRMSEWHKILRNFNKKDNLNLLT